MTYQQLDDFYLSARKEYLFNQSPDPPPVLLKERLLFYDEQRKMYDWLATLPEKTQKQRKIKLLIECHFLWGLSWSETNCYFKGKNSMQKYRKMAKKYIYAHEPEETRTIYEPLKLSKLDPDSLIAIDRGIELDVMTKEEFIKSDDFHSKYIMYLADELNDRDINSHITLRNLLCSNAWGNCQRLDWIDNMHNALEKSPETAPFFERFKAVLKEYPLYATIDTVENDLAFDAEDEEEE